MAGLTELLLATLEPNSRAQAEAQIKQAEQANVEQYFTALAQELGNAQKPTIARQLSGLLLKNGLAAKDPKRDLELKQRWGNIPVNSRNLVKEATTTALIATELDVGKAAAQVLAKIGAIEIPEGQWDGLVPLLLQHVTNTDPRARQVSLITLGYLCEELVMLQEEGKAINEGIANNVLTAVVQGMRDPDVPTKLEATRAFYHAVVLAQRNFRNENPQERDFIMEVLHELCKMQGAEMVQIAAFECLVQIATEYYDFLLAYINIIGPLTWETIRSQPEKVAIPAMEFWSTICDEEIDLLEMAACGQAQVRGGRQCLNLTQQALPHLVPLLTETLTKQQSEEDDDTWNLAMAAGTCLGLVAQVTGDNCVDLVLGFVSSNFENQAWTYREAAVLAYGSIMEGPSSEKMRPVVEQSLSHLVNRLDDPSVAVRDTLAWTLGRIAMFHPTIVPTKALAPILGRKLTDVPRVASNICWCIQVLAESQEVDFIEAPPTTDLSEFFTAFAEGLLMVSARPDCMEKNLRMSAYNALSVLVAHSGNDCNGHLEQLTQEMLKHLATSFQTPDPECELQGYICGVLTSIIQRLRGRVQPAADQMMEQCLKVIQAYKQVKQADVIQEEALLTISALVNVLGAHFEKYMPHFEAHLRVGLQNHEDVTVCLISTRLVGDCCTALQTRVAPYCENFLQILYTNLQNQAVDRRIKATIMSVFGDIAMAVAGDFDKYLAPVVQMLTQASATTIQEGPQQQPAAEEWFEYLNSLRQGVLEAYTGIIHGLRDANKLHLFKEHVSDVIKLVALIADDKTALDSAVSDSTMRAAVEVIGDLVMVFQQELTQYLSGAPFVRQLITFASRIQDPKGQKTVMWLSALLQKFGGAVTN